MWTQPFVLQTPLGFIATSKDQKTKCWLILEERPSTSLPHRDHWISHYIFPTFQICWIVLVLIITIVKWCKMYIHVYMFYFFNTYIYIYIVTVNHVVLITIYQHTVWTYISFSIFQVVPVDRVLSSPLLQFFLAVHWGRRGFLMKWAISSRTGPVELWATHERWHTLLISLVI